MSDQPNPDGPQAPDLTRLKWLDPSDTSRFTRKELALIDGVGAEPILENIVRIADEIFDHVSVLGQFPETTARGAVADPQRMVDLEPETERLRQAQLALWEAYRSLKEKRGSFIRWQLQSKAIDVAAKALKLHIGSANCMIDGWINIDAGGADLALNVNWGLPFAAGVAQFVYSSHMLEHLRHADQAPVLVREVHRVLTPGGVARFVVPDLRSLLTAYVQRDRAFFSARQKYYPLSDGFLQDGVATLDYILLYCGAGPQSLSYNHKFGYDADTLCQLLRDAGFREAKQSTFQASPHPQLRVDNFSFDARTETDDGRHYSLFVEALK